MEKRKLTGMMFRSKETQNRLTHVFVFKDIQNGPKWGRVKGQWMPCKMVEDERKVKKWTKNGKFVFCLIKERSEQIITNGGNKEKKRNNPKIAYIK